MAKFFTAEGLVIITSKDEVSAFQWRKYVEKNWDDLKQKHAVMLILAGIHGKQDGKLGNPDLGLLKDYQGQIDYFMGKSKKKQPPEKISRDISNLNIQVSKYLSRQKSSLKLGKKSGWIFSKINGRSIGGYSFLLRFGEGSNGSL